MKTSNIFYMMCATALFSSCHIYKAYDRPEDINADGIYRDPISLTDTLAVTDTTKRQKYTQKPGMAPELN